MKKILIHMVATALFCSCSGFLDEVDKDKLIPSNTAHYAAVLLSEFSNQQAYFEGVDFMTDNWKEYKYATEESRKNWKQIYTWQMEIELDEDGKRVSNNDAWEEMYEDIAVANYVIEQIDDASGTDSEKQFIKGEAYFVRGWSYLELVNLYGQPYVKETANKDMGVPIRIDNAVQQVYSRASNEETYRQILSDLIEARELIAMSGIKKSKFHPGISACEVLLSRTHLYMQNWAEAAKYASMVIDKNELSKMVAEVPYVVEGRSDILYSSQLKKGSSDAAICEKGWCVNTELIDLYDKSDIRLDAFFERVPGKIGRVYYPVKRSTSYTAMGMNNIRVAEAYLNRAEAYCKSGGDAASDMLVFLESRYRDKDDIRIEVGEELLEQVQIERRKEFCFEGHHRWFDLRRMDKRPVIYHDFTLTDANGNVTGTQRFTLLSNDLNYTLPIPLKERDNNPLIRNNERYDKLPENI